MKQLTVLTGQNEILKLEYLNKILVEFANDEVKSFYLDEVGTDAISEEVEGYSLFSKRKLLVLKNFESCSQSVKQKIKEKINNFVSKEINDTFIVILVENNIFDENERTEVVDFKRFYRSDIINYIKRRLDSEGVKYESDVPEYLSELSCDNVDVASRMLEIILNYYENGKKITVESLDLLFTREKGYGIFDLIDGIFTKDKKKAYLSLQDLKESKESVIQINHMIYRTARLMWAYLSEKDKTTIGEKLKIKPFEVKKLSIYSSKVNLKFISNIFSLIKKVEILSKTMTDDFAFLEIEKFILSF